MKKTSYTHAQILAAAMAAHEANRAYCMALGDFSQKTWREAEAWQRSSSIKGVEGVIAGNGPRESHASWWAEKALTGWKYGPVKSEEDRTHPCMVPYELLPREQQHKDGIFVDVAAAVLAAFSD
jgi:hypothetical protein